LCHACCLGKAHKRPINPNSTPLRATHLRPGDCVSTDQLESNAPGRIAVLKGRPSKESYHACTFFTDHASNKVHITLHHSTGANEALHAKHHFEMLAADNNVKILEYHGDNGVYATSEFKSSCELLQQRLVHSGVGAKHQNGVAERMIGTITRRARTMLLHAMRLWPDIITEDLWPFALKLAVDIHNSTPGTSGLSPDEIFSGQKCTRNRLADFHTFGCPVFVLEASLQDGHKLPKWKPRSRMAVYLGLSPNHATTVPLVLNTTTGLVSPQYHLVFDDNFTTVDCMKSDQIPSNWPNLFKTSSTNYLDEDQYATHTLHQSWKDPTDPTTFSRVCFEDELDQLPSSICTTDTTTVHPSMLESPEIAPGIIANHPRKNWNQNHPYSTRFKQTFSANIAALENTLADENLPFDRLTALLAEQNAIHSNSDGTNNLCQPFAFAAVDDETLHYGQLRKAPDRSKFELDMQCEVQDLLTSNSFTIVL